MLTAKQKLGALGEAHAVNYLKGLGYKILERNYRHRLGEIDIVAKFKNNLVFVEVKSQEKGVDFSPAQNVNSYKQKRLIKTAQIWLAENLISGEIPWQIDVIVVEIDAQTKRAKIEHLQNCVWAK